MKTRGRPPSRAKAYIILEFDVTENRPQCQMQTSTIENAASPPVSPNTSRKICASQFDCARVVRIDLYNWLADSAELSQYTLVGVTNESIVASRS